MHCAARAIYLMWSVWGVDSGRLILESWWHCGVAIPLAQVVVEVRYRGWLRHSEPVEVEISVVICD